jgi:hypothetical protein
LTVTSSASPSQARRRYQRSQAALLGSWRLARAVRLRSPLLAPRQAQFGEAAGSEVARALVSVAVAMRID